MSVILCKLGKERVVLCSERRSTGPNGPTPVEIPKLFQAGKLSVCGFVGLGIMPAISLAGRDPHDIISNRIFRLCAKESLWDSPRELMEALRDELAPRLGRAFAGDPARYQWLSSALKPGQFSNDPAGSLHLLTAFCLMRTPEVVIDIFTLRICVALADGRLTLLEPQIMPVVEKQPHKGEELEFNFAPPGFLLDRVGWGGLNPDGPDEQILQGFDEIVESGRAGAQCRDQVGEVTDVVSIGNNGLRWLRGGVSEKEWARAAEQMRTKSD